MQSFRLRVVPVVFAISIALVSPSRTQAIEKCSVKVQVKTGVLEVSATGVGTTPRWGVVAGATTARFADESVCAIGGKLKKCHLGDAGTLAARTPPPECVVCVGDDGPDDCCTLVKGCTPGLRVRNPSFAADDPRLAGGETGAERLFSAHFSCEEALQPGQLYLGGVPPLDETDTDVVIHNPGMDAVRLYVRAGRSTTDGGVPIAPGNWSARSLGAGEGIAIDCDGIARLLTGNPGATFIGTFGLGVRVEGTVTVGIGPNAVPGQTSLPAVDVTAHYTRGADVLKKDVHFQPWWWWWWWPLPWRLAFPYERVLAVSPGANVDCRGVLYAALTQDAQGIADTQQRTLTQQALVVGQQVDPTNITSFTADSSPAIVALLGRCEHLDASTLAVEYLLVSNKGATDADPRGGSQITPPYPWVPGHWYDLSAVVPANASVDLDTFLHQWQTQRWIDVGLSSPSVGSAMVYFFPWWCGTAYWWGWGGSGDCIDVGVGEAQSVDVVPIEPVGVTLATWPPI